MARIKTHWFEFLTGEQAKQRDKEMESEPSHFFRWPWVWFSDFLHKRRTTWQ
jgi:hypothetical protein